MTHNRCTYGRDDDCGKHGPQFEGLAYQKPGAVTTRAPSYSATGPRGVWMRNAGWRKDPKKKTTRQQAALDACAARKVTYDGPGVLIRKGRP